MPLFSFGLLLEQGKRIKKHLAIQFSQIPPQDTGPELKVFVYILYILDSYYYVLSSKNHFWWRLPEQGWSDGAGVPLSVLSIASTHFWLITWYRLPSSRRTNFWSTGIGCPRFLHGWTVRYVLMLSPTMHPAGSLVL